MKSLRSESSSLYLGQESLRAILGTLVRLSCDEAQPEANASGWRFTQQDSSELLVLRSKLTPFLRAVTKALLFELEKGYVTFEQKEAVFDEVLGNLPAENSTSVFFTNLSQVSDTLHNEFDQLLNSR